MKAKEPNSKDKGNAYNPAQVEYNTEERVRICKMLLGKEARHESADCRNPFISRRNSCATISQGAGRLLWGSFLNK